MAQPNLTDRIPEKPKGANRPARPPVRRGWFADARLRVLEVMLWMMLIFGLLGALNAPAPYSRDGEPTAGATIIPQALTLAAVAAAGLVISHRLSGASLAEDRIQPPDFER